MYKSHMYPTYNMCSCHHSLVFLLALAVKPTVIDVGIYVNSIGPVSSIDMVSFSALSHLLFTHTHSHSHIFCPLSHISIIIHECRHFSRCIWRSRRLPQLFFSGRGNDRKGRCERSAHIPCISLD